MSRRLMFLDRYKSDFQARQVARMRLPSWLAMLMPLFSMMSILVVTLASVMVLWALHRALHPEISFEAMPGIAKGLILFPSFFGTTRILGTACAFPNLYVRLDLGVGVRR